jgi:hypothetical protein
MISARLRRLRRCSGHYASRLSDLSDKDRNQPHRAQGAAVGKPYPIHKAATGMVGVKGR